MRLAVEKPNLGLVLMNKESFLAFYQCVLSQSLGLQGGVPALWSFISRRIIFSLLWLFFHFPFLPAPCLQPHVLLSFVFFLGRVWNVTVVLPLHDFSLGLWMHQKWNLWVTTVPFLLETLLPEMEYFDVRMCPNFNKNVNKSVHPWGKWHAFWQWQQIPLEQLEQAWVWL